MLQYHQNYLKKCLASVKKKKRNREKSGRQHLDRTQHESPGLNVLDS